MINVVVYTVVFSRYIHIYTLDAVLDEEVLFLVECCFVD